jgi:hypothetical protein
MTTMRSLRYQLAKFFLDEGFSAEQTRSIADHCFEKWGNEKLDVEATSAKMQDYIAHLKAKGWSEIN